MKFHQALAGLTLLFPLATVGQTTMEWGIDLVTADGNGGGLRDTDFSRRAQDSCDPGTACSADLHRNLKTQTTRRLAGGLSVVAQENGPVLLSVNGIGHTGSSSIGVLKPSSTAVVRKAFLFATGRKGDAKVTLEGVPIVWDGTATNPFLDLRSFYADVTSVVKSTVDAASAGELFIPVVETSNADLTDGEVLAVIFEDPTALVPDNSVSLLFGALNSAGDNFALNLLNLASPITAADLADPDLIMDLSLGIGFGYQGTGKQFSLVVSGHLS
jgi:hypothetical protein